MIDKGIPKREDWPEGVLEQVALWEQGDVIANPPFFYFGDPSAPVWQATVLLAAESDTPDVVIPPDAVMPPYGLVTTQTCDIGEEESSQPVKPWVQVVPVYPLSDKGWSKKVRRGGGPRHWLHVPNLPGDETWVADFRIEVPVEKGWLAGQERIDGFGSSEAKLAVGRRLAHIRGRPAFSKAMNDAVVSPLYRFLEDQGGTDDDPDEIGDELSEKVVEAVVSVDDPLNVGTAQVTALTLEPLSAEAIERIKGWWDGAQTAANEAGIVLMPVQVKRDSEFSVEEYRRTLSLWTK